MTSRTRVRITFDGDALVTGEMDARDLAGSLFALADLCESAGKVLYGDTAKVSVSVKANFREGSFGIDTILNQGWVSSLIGMLSSKEMDATTNAVNLMHWIFYLGSGGGSLGLVALLRRLKGRKVTSVAEGDGSKRIISLADGEVIEERKEVLDLYRDISTRKNLSKFLDPLDREGIDDVLIGQDGNVQKITKEEYPYFKYSPSDADPTENEMDITFGIVSPVFKKGQKWRVTDGTSTFYVDMLDEEFIDKVENGEELFGKGDILNCRVRLLQKFQEEELKSKFQIVKVYNHRRVSNPQKLPFKNSE